MGKPKSITTPLWINLEEAVNDVKIIFDQGGGSLSKENFAIAKKQSAKSSGFLMGCVALRTYGLVQTGRSDLELTLLARSIVAPESDKEREDAILKAFYGVTIYQALHSKYKSGFLPEKNFLVNFIHKEFGSSVLNSGKWATIFIDSGIYSGVLKRDGGKIRVMSTPDSKPGVNANREPGERVILGGGGAGNEDNLFPQIPKNNIPFHLPTGANRVVTIPQDLTEKELQYLATVIDAYIKNRD
jgi:hypothetical protein